MALEPMAIGVMLGVGEDPAESIRKVLEVGVNNAQMGRPADEWLSEERARELKAKIDDSGITITTVFCGFDGESYADIPTVRRTVGFVPLLGVETVAAHVGFVPEEPDDPQYAQVVEVVGQFADYLKSNGQRLALETGQETAPTLLRFINDLGRDNVFVNFDPANMILYGSGDPIEALKLVGKHVVGVHCKDGKPPTEPDKLGTETPLGEGDVGIERFIRTLKEIGYSGPLTIEREITGEEQKRDIIEARKLLERIRDEVLAS